MGYVSAPRFLFVAKRYHITSLNIFLFRLLLALFAVSFAHHLFNPHKITKTT